MSDFAPLAYYSARPALLVNGRFEAGLSDGVMDLLVEETTDGMARAEVTIGNWGRTSGQIGYLYFDRQLLDFGAEFAIEFGEGRLATRVFEGRIMALEGRYPARRNPEIAVLAEDALQDLRMTRRTRSFEDMNDEDLFDQVAREHGLTAEVDVDGVQHRALAQVNQSDLAFLRQRARAIDAELWLEGGTLHVQARARREAGEVTLRYGQRLREFTVLADLAGQSTSFTVAGWDSAGKEPIEARADDAALRGELAVGHLSGGTVLRQALGERDQRIVHGMPATDDEARALAEARFRQGARRFVTGTGIAEGDGNIRVGTRLTLLDLGVMFDGAYDVTEVRHTFHGAEGFRTRFRVERPGIGA